MIKAITVKDYYVNKGKHEHNVFMIKFFSEHTVDSR